MIILMMMMMTDVWFTQEQFHSKFSSCSNILTAFLLLLAGIVVSWIIFALEVLYTSHKAHLIASQVTYDRVEFMIPRKPTKDKAMDDRMLFVRTHERSRKPWKMAVSDKRKL